MTPREISEKLASDASAVCRMLLPDGKRIGNEWRAGSVAGDKGKSLGVHLTGTKAGVWADFNGGSGGDLLDLWAQTKGVTIGEAIQQTKAYLGISAPDFQGYRKPVFRRPAKPECSKPRGNVAHYLDNRGITSEALKAYRVAASQDDTEIIFPYLRDGELVNVKYLKLERVNNKKQIRLEKDCEPCLFGWQAIPENSRSVTICEGEIDALTLWQYGFPALSVFSGAGNHTWIENEFLNLERFDEIFLCFDRDEAGEKGCRQLVERLGRERCRVVQLPYKDANECLRQDIDAEAMREIFANARYCDPAELRNASEYVDEVIREFYPQEGDPTGFITPWPKLGAKLRFRPGELVLLNGVNGHGKTHLMGHLALAGMDSGEKFCVASLEMWPRKWLRWLAMQASGKAEPSPQHLHLVADWFADKLWVFDVTGTAKVERMLEVFAYARCRYGVTSFVIDSLLKCGIAEKDYDAQKLLVEKLCDFAMEHEVTMFLITHSRKGEKAETERSKPGDKFDIRGTTAISDLASTVLTCWRNKAKEEKPDENKDAPDAMLLCDKQRNGDWEGRIWLSFHHGSQQFLEHGNAIAHAYVPHLQAVANDIEI